MKLQRLMLAVLAVCGTSAAMAQSSVTIYGRVNTSIEHQKLGNAKVTGMFDNASRIGFKGVEDLGGGLKAGFQLEAGFNADNGSGASGKGMSFNRQSEVNLSGNWGMLRLGNFTAESYFATADYVSWINHDTGTSADALYYDPVMFGALGQSNKISYRTPEMGGFWAEAAMQLHENNPTYTTQGGNGQNKNGYDLAANYAAGNLGLGAGYSQVGKNKQAALRVNYAFGPVMLGAYYQRNDEKTLNLGTRNNFRLSAMYTFGASELILSAGHASKWSNVADSSATQWTLGYNYNLSKRTKVFAYYNHVKNKSAANYAYGYFGGASANVPQYGAKSSSIALGVRHNF